MSYPGSPAPSRLRRALRPVLAAAVDLIYPRLCCGCKAPLEPGEPRTGIQTWFCPACEKNLPWLDAPYCRVCGETYDGSFSAEFRCMNCSGRRLEFEFAIAACHAEDTVRELVHQFKYERRLQLRGALATLLLRTLDEPRLSRESLASWLLVPVPLHREREKEREFNQSWELCQRLQRLTGVPAAKALARTRETDAQAGLDREERLQNLRGAFSLRKTWPWQKKPPLQGRSILLVDDVFTTGATTSECARVLRREGGAQKVVVITVARG
ncbi:MAG TPA: ComF family protein [Prosthecobacter sp.]